MLTPVPPTDCARARESASARLDGELVDLQAAGLEAHLRSCPECSAYAAGIELVADQLRAAPLDQPAGVSFTPQRRRRIRLVPAAAAAAIVVAVAGSSFVVGGMVGGRQSASTSALPNTATSALGGSVDALLLPLLATPGSRASGARSRTIAF
jgi:predicted anti-sigma-YlaC factor YlaD